MCFTPDDAVIETVTRPEEVERLGSDAIAVAIGVRGPNEGKFLKIMTQMVEEADRIVAEGVEARLAAADVDAAAIAEATREELLQIQGYDANRSAEKVARIREIAE